MPPAVTLSRVLLLIPAALLLFAGCSRAPKKADENAPPPPLADPYPNEPVNIDLWLERLEVSSRELYSARMAVANAVDAKPGDRIADIGAGTGIYSLLFAEKVGQGGVVYAVDIAARFLTLINQRASDLNLGNVVAVLGRDDSITLPPNSVDVVFIADTYHYFDDPGAIMKTVLAALKPGGSLYIVDYNLAPGETPPPEKRHVRFGKASVAAEVESFGFSQAEDVSVSGLKENYMIRFRKPS